MWFWIWCALALGALAAAALVLRHLWRRVRRVGAALGEAGALADRFDEHLRAAEQQWRARTPRPVTVFDDPAEARLRVVERAEVRAGRRAARRARWRERWAWWGRPGPVSADLLRQRLH